MVIREIRKRKISDNLPERYLGDREFLSFQEIRDYIRTQFEGKKLLDNVIYRFLVMDTQEEIIVCVNSIYLDEEYIGNELIWEV